MKVWKRLILFVIGFAFIDLSGRLIFKIANNAEIFLTLEGWVVILALLLFGGVCILIAVGADSDNRQQPPAPRRRYIRGLDGEKIDVTRHDGS